MATKKVTAQRALRMRTAGIPYEKIADELGLTTAKAHEAVTDALQAQRGEDPGISTRIELERLDAMLVGLWKNVTRGDVKAVEQAMRISERRAELLATADKDTGGNGVGDHLDQIRRSALDERPDATIYPIDGSTDA